MKYGSALISGFVAKVAGLSGHLAFAWVAANVANGEKANAAVQLIIYSSLVATLSRLGLDNFFISRYRESRPRSLSFASAACFLTASIFLFLLALLVSLLPNIGSFSTLGVSYFFLAFSFNLNAVSANSMVAYGWTKTALLLKGNVVFVVATVALYIDSSLTEFVLACFVGASSTVLLAFALNIIQLTQESARATTRHFVKWVRAYIYAGRSGIIFGIVNNLWMNWIYLLSNAELLEIEGRHANLYQRIVNAANAVSQTVFFIAPAAVPQSALRVLLLVWAVLLIGLFVIFGWSGSGAVSAVSVGVLFGIFNLCQIPDIERMRYSAISLKISFLMLLTGAGTFFFPRFVVVFCLAFVVVMFLELIAHRQARVFPGPSC